MRDQPVLADRDTEASHGVHGDGQAEIEPADPMRPELHQREDASGDRRDDEAGYNGALEHAARLGGVDGGAPWIGTVSAGRGTLQHDAGRDPIQSVGHHASRVAGMSRLMKVISGQSCGGERVQIARTLFAWSPFGPCSDTNDTFWPSTSSR